MSRLSYVVVSTPRSGTRYTARLLSAAGLQCGHEQCFGFSELWSQVSWRLERKDREGVWGDSSWLAAPHLGEIPEDVVILYQMRNPLDTIRSIIRQNLTSEPYVQPGQFAWEQAGLKGDLTPERAAAQFWCEWHKMIQEQLFGRLNTYSVRLESWSLEALNKLLGKLPLPLKREEDWPLDLMKVHEALQNKRENHRQSQADQIFVPRRWAIPEMSEIIDLVYRFDSMFERL